MVWQAHCIEYSNIFRLLIYGNLLPVHPRVSLVKNVFAKPPPPPTPPFWMFEEAGENLGIGNQEFGIENWEFENLHAYRLLCVWFPCLKDLNFSYINFIHLHCGVGIWEAKKKNQTPDVERYTSVQVACREKSETKNIGGFPPARNIADFFTEFWWIFWGIIFFGGRTSYMYVRSRFPDG